MNQATAPCRSQLKSIARRAMLQRGLLPDFSAEVIAETSSIANAATASDTSMRDLRSLLWASIDNDDSLDLDQLSVAEQLAGGAVKVLVAITDVDAIAKKGSAIDGDYRAPSRVRGRFAERFASGSEESRYRADRRFHDRGKRGDGEIPRAERFSGAAPRSALA